MTKKNTLLFLLASGAGWLIFTSYSSGPGGGGLGDLSASNCGGSGCHAANNAGTVVQAVTLVDVGGGAPTPPGQYIPGRTYAVTILGSLNPGNTALTHFGFQTTARNSANATVGTISLASTTQLQTYTGSGRTGVEHSTRIAKNSGGFFTKTWQWTAPAAGTGTVTFNTIINAVNNNGNVNGDQANTGTTAFSEAPLAVAELSGRSTLSFGPNPARDFVRIDTRSWRNGDYSIAVVTSTGSLVMKQVVRHNGSDAMEISLPALSAGLYAFRIQGNGRAESAPLFIR